MDDSGADKNIATELYYIQTLFIKNIGYRGLVLTTQTIHIRKVINRRARCVMILQQFTRSSPEPGISCHWFLALLLGFLVHYYLAPFTLRWCSQLGLEMVPHHVHY